MHNDRLILEVVRGSCTDLPLRNPALRLRIKAAALISAGLRANVANGQDRCAVVRRTIEDDPHILHAQHGRGHAPHGGTDSRRTSAHDVPHRIESAGDVSDHVADRAKFTSAITG